MKIYGYTEEKDTVAVDLSVDEIVAAGIDPWRLDLFDADPVDWTAEGKRLYFRKFSDLAFGYRERDGGPLIIGLHDGSRGVCFCGAEEEVNDSRAILNTVRESDQPFEHHLRKYLAMIDRGFKFGWLRFSSCSSAYDGSNSLDKKLAVAVAPQPACALRMQGDKVWLKPSADAIKSQDTGSADRMHPLMFVGEMMTELETPASLDSQVNWVLTTFAQFRPVVFGESLRRSLGGRRLRKIEFLVEQQFFDALHDLLQQQQESKWQGGSSLFTDVEGNPADLIVYQSDGKTLEFDVGIVTYVASIKPQEVADVFRSDGHRFSPDCLYSSKPNTICGARIALFDSGAMKARPLYAIDVDSLTGPQNETNRCFAKMKLEENGFQVLEPWKSRWYPPKPDRAG